MDSKVITTSKVVGLFAILGIGLGIANFIVLDQFLPASSGQQDAGASLVGGLLMLQAISFIYFVGPATAVVSGLFTGREEKSAIGSAIAGGVGGFIGFYIMFILAFLIMSMAFPEASGGGGDSESMTNLGNNLVQMVIVGIPTGMVSLGTGYLTNTDS